MADMDKLDRTDEYRQGYKAGFEVGRRKVQELSGQLMDNRVDASQLPTKAQMDKFFADHADLANILRAWATRNAYF